MVTTLNSIRFTPLRAYQLLVLTEMQNKVGKKNNLGNIFKETIVKLDWRF